MISWLLAPLLGLASLLPVPPTPPPPTLVVVELFTSEGCSSCPAADAVLRDVDRTQPVPGVEVIALGQHVDYWNRLGWRDPFSAPAFTARQGEYAAHLGSGNYTPQAVVQGRTELVGSRRTELVAAIRAAAARTQARVAVSWPTPGQLLVRVSDVPAGAGQPTVRIALVESGLATAVRRGENAGRTLQHAPLVRRWLETGALRPDGSTTVKVGEVPADWVQANLRVVALVQDGAGGSVLGAATAAWPR